MIVVLFWLIGILSLLVGVCPMSKQASDLPSVSIVPFVRKLRPAAAIGYRLLDGQNRLFPPLEQPPYHARARIDSPDVPAGLYGIRFEDAEGNHLAYTDDGSLTEIQLDGCAVIQSPDEVSIYQERGWQGVEKHELRHRRKHIRNESLQNFAGMLHDAHGLLFESHREVKESQKYVTDMIRNVMDLQRTMLEQQKALTVQVQSATPPPAPENWASATPKILRELGDVVKVAMMATSTDRAARSGSPALLEAQSKPAAALENPAPVVSAEEPSNTPAAAKSPVNERAAEPPASAPLASASPLPTAARSLVAAQPPLSAAPLAPPPAAPSSVGAESLSAPAPLLPSASPSGAASAPLAPSSAPSAATGSAPLAEGAPPVPLDASAPLAQGESPHALAAPAPSAAAAPLAVAPPAVPLAASAPSKTKSPPSEPPSTSPPPPPAPSVSPPSAPAPATAAPSSDPSAQRSGQPGLSEGSKGLVRSLPAASTRTPPAPDLRASGARLLLWRLRCMLAQGLWKEIKRRIISLPDSTLHLAVSNRETFLAWLQWVAEPAKLLRGTP